MKKHFLAILCILLSVSLLVSCQVNLPFIKKEARDYLPTPKEAYKQLKEFFVKERGGSYDWDKWEAIEEQRDNSGKLFSIAKSNGKDKVCYDEDQLFISFYNNESSSFLTSFIIIADRRFDQTDQASYSMYLTTLDDCPQVFDSLIERIPDEYVVRSDFLINYFTTNATYIGTDTSSFYLEATYEKAGLTYIVRGKSFTKNSIYWIELKWNS